MSELIREFHKLPYDKRVSFHIQASDKGLTIEEFLLTRANSSFFNFSPKSGQSNLEVV